MTTATAERLTGSKQTGHKRFKKPTTTKTRRVTKVATTTVRFKDRDSLNGITKKTAVLAADEMGVSLNALILMATRQLVQRMYRDYPVPDTEVTAEGIAYMEKLSGPMPAGGTVLFNALDL